MRAMIIAALLICLAIVPMFANAGERTFIEPDKDILLGGGNPISYSGSILANTSDIITLNWKQGTLSDDTKFLELCIVTYGNPVIKWDNMAESAVPLDPNCPSGWNYFNTIIGPASSPRYYWIVPSSTGLITFWMTTNSALTLNITIIHGNYLFDRETILQNITRLQAQVKDLQTNMSNTQVSIYYLTQKINALNTTLTSMNNTQNQILDNISQLWINLDKLKVSLDDLAIMVNGLNTSLNFSSDIARIDHNLTQINTDLTTIQDQLKVLSKDKDKVKGLQDQLNDTMLNISAINSTVTIIKSTMPKAYNDTALKSRVAQLEYENNKLSDDLKSMNKKQEQASVQRGDDFKIVILAMIIGIIGIMFGVFALIFAPISRMPKGLDTQDLNIVKPPSDDYDELEQSPRHIPKAKAKKK
jgi:septation ring formation regulator EzrA